MILQRSERNTFSNEKKKLLNILISALYPVVEHEESLELIGAFSPQARRSAHSAERGEPRVAQERQQVAERAFPQKRGDGPVAVLLQINRAERAVLLATLGAETHALVIPL